MLKVSGMRRYENNEIGVDEHVGKATRGYDPSVDIEWLRGEIVRWVLGNLMEKWYVGRYQSWMESYAH
jgi:ribosome-binding ATPase YchF (GTP1/OBG family)